MARHARLKKANAGPVVRLLFKLERAAVLHELSEFTWVAPAQFLKRRLNLLFLDVVVLFILAPTRQALPRQRASHEVEQDVTDRLEVISARLLNAFVGRDGSVAGRAGEVLAVLVGDVFSLAVFVALSQAEIDDIDVVTSSFSSSDQKVVRFDVSVDNAFLMDLFDASDHLHSDLQNRLQIELPLARLEQVLQRRAKQVHHHHVEVLVGNRTVCPNVVERWHACCTQNELLAQWFHK